MKKRILLTGASGFIGRNLGEYLKSYKFAEYWVFAPTHQELDLLDKEATKRYIINNSIDVIIHCANVNNLKHNINQYSMLNMSLQMFISLAEVSPIYDKMLYFGSGAEYDRFFGKHMLVEEDLGSQIPQDPYGFAKYIEAKLVSSFDNIYDLCLFGVYGKYEEWQRRFISNNIVRSLKQLPMTLKQNAMFDYLYVEDLCRIVVWFIEHEPKHKRYNVCTGQPVDLLSLAHIINDISGLDRAIEVEKDGWQPEYTGDNSRLLCEIGGFRFTDVRESIEEMWRHYTEHIDEYDKSKLLK